MVTVGTSAADTGSTKKQNDDGKDSVSTPLATEGKISKASPHPGTAETEGQWKVT